MIKFKNFHAKNFYTKARRGWKESLSEYNEVLKIDLKALKEFNKELIRNLIDNGIDVPNPQQEKKKKNKKEYKEKFESDTIKKIFREAAKQSHPDSGSLSNNMELFKDLIQAKKDNELNKFLDIAKKIDNNTKEKLKTNIKPEKEIGTKTNKVNDTEENVITFNNIEQLEKEVEELQSKIFKIKNSVHWVWYYADPKLKTKIIANAVNFINDDQKQKN